MFRHQSIDLADTYLKQLNISAAEALFASIQYVILSDQSVVCSVPTTLLYVPSWLT